MSKVLREVVRPRLRSEGFVNFTDRNAWRIGAERIDVVNFQSYNSYMAEGLGCTTYSFSVNLGVYLRFVPDHLYIGRDPWKSKRNLPKEAECNFRGPLRRNFPQAELARRDIWYVDPKGNYLNEVANGVSTVLLGEGMIWFEKFGDKHRILEILQNSHPNMDYLFGFGSNPSPMRSLLTGYTALSVGNVALAKVHLEEVLRSSSFDALRDQIHDDIANAT